MPPKEETAFTNAPLKTLFNGEPANFKNWMFLLESHLSQRGFQVEGLNDAQETQLFHIIVLSTEGAATDVLMEVKDKKATSALKLLKA